MEELQKIAKAYYNGSTQTIRDAARNFFDTLDIDGDGKVDCNEFLSVMSQMEISMDLTGFRNLFRELDTDQSGTLDFWEVMTLFYMNLSPRPYCDGCRKLIPEVFFTCVECYESLGDNTYDLCLECYGRGIAQAHTHNGQSQFLDNYSMLYNMRNLSQETLANQNQVSNTAWGPAQISSSSTAIVPRERDKLATALKTIEICLTIGDKIASEDSLCSIM